MRNFKRHIKMQKKIFRDLKVLTKRKDTNNSKIQSLFMTSSIKQFKIKNKFEKGKS